MSHSVPAFWLFVPIPWVLVPLWNRALQWYDNSIWQTRLIQPQKTADKACEDLTKPEPGIQLEAGVPANWVFGPLAAVDKNRKYCSLEIITCWTDRKEVAVPLELKVGLGL